MIPLNRQYVKGYYLVNNFGDVYCFGSIDFPGTVSSLFPEEDETSIVDCAFVDGVLILVSSKGCLYALSHHAVKRNSNVDNVVACVHVEGSLHLLTQDGEIYNDSGELIYSPEIKVNQSFVDMTLNSADKTITLLREDGICQIVSLSEGLLEEMSIGAGVGFRSIASATWHRGAWCLDSPGGIFNIGTTDYYGSVPEDGASCLAKKVISSPSDFGYWILDSRGLVLPFGDAKYYGHLKPNELTGEIVSMCIVVTNDRGDRDFLFKELVENDIFSIFGGEKKLFPEPNASHYEN